MKPLITGATGLVGRRLVRQFSAPVVCTREPQRARALLGGGVTALAWQPEREALPAAALAGVDVVFHLAGEPVAEGRWSAAKRRAIRASRVEGTRRLVEALSNAQPRPQVLVSASAVGFYGDRGETELSEAAAPADTFLAEVCVAWEAEAMRAEALGVRVVTMRTGIVLAADGGALPRMLPAFRWGLGAQLGHGRQWMPWIHVDDVVGLFMHAASAPTLSGPVNVVAPQPVTNRLFTQTLGEALGRPARLAVPRWVLRAALGEMSAIVCASQRVVPQAAQQSGYRFVWPQLRPALEACLRA